MTVLDIQFQALARRDAKPLLEIVRNFTPNWFTVTMGTGALALTLNQFPLPTQWLCGWPILRFSRCSAFSMARAGFSSPVRRR